MVVSRRVGFRFAAVALGPTEAGAQTNGPSVFAADLASNAVFPVSFATAGFGGSAGDEARSSRQNSGDGRVVAFVSAATNLGGGDALTAAGFFAHDRTTGETIRVDASVAGGAADGSALINSSLRFSGSPTVPSPSSLVSDSVADDLTYGDTNGVADVFSATLSL
jgi:hypothetical protein